jgi:hypothetical protein
MASTKRLGRCQLCSAFLFDTWFTIHNRRGHLVACTSCVTDTLLRWDAEGARQVAELEDAWTLPFSAIGPDGLELEGA